MTPDELTTLTTSDALFAFANRRQEADPPASTSAVCCLIVGERKAVSQRPGRWLALLASMGPLRRRALRPKAQSMHKAPNHPLRAANHLTGPNRSGFSTSPRAVTLRVLLR